jgi:LysM repeat protein
MFRKILYFLIVVVVAILVVVVSLYAIPIGGIFAFSHFKAGSNAVETNNGNVAPSEETGSHSIRQTTASGEDSGAFYTVAKGDNPVLIAKKLHVSCEDLLKLNKIDDPKKLQIGQKLRIPATSKT